MSIVLKIRIISSFIPVTADAKPALRGAGTREIGRTQHSLPEEALWQFNVIRLGVGNALAAFEMLMDTASRWTRLRDASADVIVFGKTFRQHLQYIGEVIETLLGTGLNLSPN